MGFMKERDRRELMHRRIGASTIFGGIFIAIAFTATCAFAQAEQTPRFARLLLWIESQSLAIIALIIFGACYACAAVIFAFARVTPRRIADELKGTTPVMLTPMAVITGLVIAFVAARIWVNFDHANALVRDEARNIQEVLTLAETLPPNIASEVRSATGQYLQFVNEQDWPAMLEGRAKMLTSVPGLSNAISTIVSYVPDNAGRQFAQQRILIAIEQALDARRNRILVSEASVLPMQWIVIIVLALLMLLTVAIVHIDRPFAMAVNLVSLSTALAICLVLLLVNDRPFSTGGFVIRPHALGPIAID